MSDPSSEVEYRIKSNGLIHAPGMMANFRHMFNTGDEIVAIKAIALGMPDLPIGLVWSWLTADPDMKVELKDEGETLVIKYP